MPRLLASHRTEIVYAGSVGESVNEVHLTPRSEGRQRVEWARLSTRPGAELRRHADAYGNIVHWFQLTEPHSTLVVEAEALVETRPQVPGAAGDLGRDGLGDPAYRDEMAEFLVPSAHVRWPDEVARLAGRMGLPADAGVHEWLEAVEAGVNDAIAYTVGVTVVDTPLEHVVRDRRGVCQDMAHVMLALCRWSGVAARYVSGWLHLPGHEGPAESHAWIEAAVPGAGWRDFDPTHPRPAWEDYVRIAVGRDYADVAPLRGSYTGPRTEEMRVSVEIRAVP